MVEPGGGRATAGHALAWLWAFAIAMIAAIGAMGPDGLSAAITEDVAELCLACVPLGSHRLQQGLSVNRLTARELQISRHVALGWKNQDIAKHLGVSVRTIETHLHHAYGKLGLATRLQLVLLVRADPDA